MLMLDCEPWLMRGISYSPVPYGQDPSYYEPYGDYFTDQYLPLLRRDMDLFVRMGANTVRLYAWRQSVRHTRFLDLCDELNLVVVAVYEMGTAEDTPVSTVAQRNRLRGRLLSRLTVSRHRAIIAWQIGNELNGAWNGYVCNAEYSALFLHAPCAFGDVAPRLCELIDSMCEVVRAEGRLCSTPFADAPTPNRYAWTPYSLFPGGMKGWVEVCEAKRLTTDDSWWGGMQYLDFWSGNLYPGKDFTSFDFAQYGRSSSLPLMVSEYGVDAYDTDHNCDPPISNEEVDRNLFQLSSNPAANLIGCENEGMQAEWVLSLVEDVERHSSVCELGCAPEEEQVTVGGAVMAWADEYWKGRVIDATEFDNRTDAMGPLCPDPFATAHTPCGYPSGAQPDRYVNEEWFGLFKIAKPCANKVDQIRARQAWHRLRLLWKDGGCISFDDRSQPLPTYNQSLYPDCGPRIAGLRQAAKECRDNASACPTRALANWDGTDCFLQEIASTDDRVCPPLPAHMADINQTIYEAQQDWHDEPRTCPTDITTWFQNNGFTVGFWSIVFLYLWGQHKRRVYSYLRRLLKPVQLRLIALRAFARKKDLGFATTLNPQSLYRDVGVTGLATPSADILHTFDGMPTLVSIYESSCREPKVAASYVSQAEKEIRDAKVRGVLMPIAAQLASTFGLQTMQVDSSLGNGTEYVPSNVSNQVEHLC